MTRARRISTSPGLGAPESQPPTDPDRTVTQSEMPGVVRTGRGNAERVTIRGETRWSSTPPKGQPPSEAEPATRSSAPPPRSARSSRVPVSVDDVEGAVRLGRNALDLLRRTVPRLRRGGQDLTSAPIDHREGFILALVDGKTTVQGLIDVAGMHADDVITMLQRLRRLGIITLG